MSGVDTIHLVLRRSTRLGVGLALLHAGTLAPLWSMGMPLALSAAFTVVLACHGWWSIQRFALSAAARSVGSVDLDGARRCAITQRSGRVLHGTVAGTTLVTGGLVILAVRVERSRPLARVVIVSDMVDAETFRRLRVLLRWAGGDDPRPHLFPV